MPVLGNNENNSALLRFMESVTGRSGWAWEVINQQLKILMGDGWDTFGMMIRPRVEYYGFAFLEYLCWLELR